MKESFGATFLFQIVIVFLLLFTAIMCLTINNTKAFAVKNEVVSYIESQGGIDISRPLDNRNDGIVDILSKAGYFTTGKCETGYTAYNRDGSLNTSTSNKSAICIKKIDSNQETGGCYFEIMVFYRLDLPVFGSVFNFKTTGKTKVLFKCD